MSDADKAAALNLPFSIARAKAEQAGFCSLRDEVTLWFEQYHARVLRYLCSLGLPVHDAEEIVQEVFLSLFKHLQAEKSRSNLRGWIFRVAHNQGLKRCAANGLRKQTQEWVDDAGANHPHDPGPSAEEQIFMKQRRKRLLSVVEALPEQDRHCLYLRAEGLPYREIAEVLEISLGSVSQSLTRAVKRLSDADYR